MKSRSVTNPKNQNNMKKSIFLSGLFSILFGLLAYTQGDLPNAPSPFRLYNNLSKELPGFLSNAEASQIEQKLRAFNDSTGNQIVIIIVDDLLGYEAWDYATRIGENWKVGQEKKDNGIVFLIKPTGGKGQKKTHIAIGKGLEGAIPDAIAIDIVNHEVLPNFKTGDYYQGVNNAIVVLMDLANGEYGADEYTERVNSWSWSDILLFIIFLPIIILSSIFGRRNGGRGGRTYGGGFGVGGGGFGGGSFGGGGAGGSW